jgi:hypothetical protein
LQIAAGFAFPVMTATVPGFPDDSKAVCSLDAVIPFVWES